MRIVGAKSVLTFIPIAFLVTSMCMLQAFPPQKASTQSSSSITVEDGSIIFQTATTVLTFNSATGSITSIDNLLTGQLTTLSSHYSLWSISTSSGGFITYSSSLNSFSYDIVSNSLLKMQWSVSNPTFEINVIAMTDSVNEGIDLSINVTNLNPGLTIESVDFPYIAGFNKLGNSSSSDTLAIPKRDGLLIPDFQSTLKESGSVRFEYIGSLTMQFYLIYDQSVGGIYVGAQDPNSNYKALEIQNNTYAQPGYKLFWELYPPQIAPGNQFVMGYYVSMASFSGGSWENGALLYRDWALYQQYTKMGTLLSRTDIPSWFKNIGLLWKVSPPDASLPSTAQTVNYDFPGESELLDLWGWNLYGFDSGYGNYFPPADGQTTLSTAVDQVNQMGDGVMMFFSGVLVDTNSTTNPDFPSEEQNMIVTSGGSLYLQPESNGAEMAVPDPTTSWWMDQLVNYSVTAVKDYNASGVYLDGLGDQGVVLNYRNSSSPTLSGATWWEAFARILTNMTASMRAINPNAIITAEGESEAFIPYLSGFWVNMNQDDPVNSGIPGAIEVPMFSFVFHEYSLSYGTPFPYEISGSSYGSPSMFRYTISKALSYGLVLRPDLPTYIQLAPNDSKFLGDAIDLETAYSGYLRFGQMLPGPTSTGGNMTNQVGGGFIQTVPALSEGLFQASNGTDILVVSNPTTIDQNVTLNFYGSEFGAGEQVTSVSLCQAAATGQCSETNSSGDVNVSVGALTDEILHVVPTLQIETTSTVTSQSATGTTGVSSQGSSTTSSTSGSSTSSPLGGVATYAVPIAGAILVVGAVFLVFRNRSKR
jgi:hypothetical protein